MFAFILKELIVSFVLPVAVDTVKSYVKSSDTKNDDKVLELTQIGAKYLAGSSTNTVTQTISDSLNNTKMNKVQKAR